MTSNRLHRIAALSFAIVPLLACSKGNMDGSTGASETGFDDGSSSADDDTNTISATNGTFTTTDTDGTVTVTVSDTSATTETSATVTDTDATTLDTSTSSVTDTDTTSTESGGTTGTGECAQVMLSGDLYPASTNGDTGGVFRISGEFVGDAGFRDRFSIEFYAADTGPFDLAMAPDDNYATCAQCIRVVEDLDFDAGDAARVYFQSAGSIDVDAASEPFGATLSADLAGVHLVEVTIDPDTFESTPVPGGACIDIVDATVTATTVPAEWVCDPDYFSGFDGCDCGCGIVDLDCVDDTGGSCNYCDDMGSCSMDMCPGMIDPANNAACM